MRFEHGCAAFDPFVTPSGWRSKVELGIWSQWVGWVTGADSRHHVDHGPCSLVVVLKGKVMDSEKPKMGVSENHAILHALANNALPEGVPQEKIQKAAQWALAQLGKKPQEEEQETT